MEINSAGTNYSHILKTNKIGDNNKRNDQDANDASESIPALTKNIAAISDNNTVVYEKTKNNSSAEYNTEIDKINKNFEEMAQRGQGLKTMIEKLIKRQGLAYETAINVISSDDEVLVPVGDEARKQAEKDIAEKGYYGVKQASERILDFAKAISNGEISKVNAYKSAITEGFEEAGKQWSGKLPAICRQTYHIVERDFDEWSKSLNII